MLHSSGFLRVTSCKAGAMEAVSSCRILQGLWKFHWILWDASTKQGKWSPHHSLLLSLMFGDFDYFALSSHPSV